MAVPWVLDSLEQYARYPMMQKRVTPEGCLGLFRRQVYLEHFEAEGFSCGTARWCRHGSRKFSICEFSFPTDSVGTGLRPIPAEQSSAVFLPLLCA